MAKEWGKVGKIGEKLKKWRKVGKKWGKVVKSRNKLEKRRNVGKLGIFFTKWPAAAILDDRENHFRSHFSPFQVNAQLSAYVAKWFLWLSGFMWLSSLKWFYGCICGFMWIRVVKSGEKW